MKFIKIILSVLFLGLSSLSYADHLAGGYFEYKSLGGNSYQIDFFMLRDCVGIEPVRPVLSRKSDCGSSCAEIGEMELVSQSIKVDYGCGNTCDNPSGGKPGYETFRYRTIVTLPSVCDSWIFSVEINARNSVGYLNSSGNYYNYCRINNSVANSSANVSGANVVVGCNGYTASSLFTITGTDGDQVVYDLVDALTGEGFCNSSTVDYATGINAQKPFPSNQNFALNATTGAFTFLPYSIGTNYFAVRAREYRNSVLIGEIVVDGMIFIKNCAGGNSVTFGNFSGSGNNQWTVPGVDKEYCETFLLYGDDNADVHNVIVTGPDYMTYEVLPNVNGQKQVKICVNIPPELLCSQFTKYVQVSASAGGTDCVGTVNGAGDIGYYAIRKQKGAYCQKNLYFTNRAPTNNPMPAFARAQDTIWVGDDMPLSAPPSLPGPVIIDQEITLVAGKEVVLPACATPVACVTMNAGSSIYIRPNVCSDSCDQVVTSLSVAEIFDCSNERLIANANGEAPFTFTWNVNGIITTTSSNVMNVHSIVETTNGGAIPYTVTVQDAGGQLATSSGTIPGTKRFYEDVRDNTTYYEFPEDIFGYPETINGVAGNYYGASIFCVQEHPAYIFDAKNSGPPWYGATSMEFEVKDRWGGTIYYDYINLAGGTDWSFDNGQFYWNGRMNNNLADSCVYPAIDVVVYKLRAKNCFTAIHLENAAFSLDDGTSINVPGCTSEDSLFYYLGTVDHAKTMDGDNGGGVYNGGRFEDRPLEVIQASNGVFAYCIPNPTSGTFAIKSNQLSFENVLLLDLSGKVVMKFATLASGEEISVERLSSGVYTLVLNGNHIKIVKE